MTEDFPTRLRDTADNIHSRGPASAAEHLRAAALEIETLALAAAGAVKALVGGTDRADLDDIQRLAEQVTGPRQSANLAVSEVLCMYEAMRVRVVALESEVKSLRTWGRDDLL